MAVTVDVSYEARYWYPDDGAIVWVAGYTPIDAESGRYLARDAPELTARGLIATGLTMLLAPADAIELRER